MLGLSHPASSSPCFILTLLTLRLSPAKVKTMYFGGHENHVYFLCSRATLSASPCVLSQAVTLAIEKNH